MYVNYKWMCPSYAYIQKCMALAYEDGSSQCLLTFYETNVNLGTNAKTLRK